MARLRDIKVGMTVWIKKGSTSEDDFGMGSDTAQAHYIGKQTTVTQIDEMDDTCTVLTEQSIWWPTDWISLTPPNNESKEVENTQQVEEIGMKKEEKKYVACSNGDWFGPNTLETIIEEMTDCGWEFPDDMGHIEFYEVKKVSVKSRCPSQSN